MLLSLFMSRHFVREAGKSTYTFLMIWTIIFSLSNHW